MKKSMLTGGVIVAVMTSALAGVAPREMEMRVPRGCYLVSHRVSWFGDSGYFAGMCLFFVADDGMVYPGTGVNMGGVYVNEGKWKAMLDERPSRCGRLEKGEVVRVVVTDLKAIPLLGRGTMDVRPYGPALAGIDECRISLFLLSGKIGARLHVDFFDEAKANAAKELFEAEKPLTSTRSVMEENLAWAKAQGNQGDIARTEMVRGWVDGLKVDFKDKALLVVTGLIDAQQLFTVMAESLADTLEMF